MLWIRQRPDPHGGHHAAAPRCDGRRERKPGAALPRPARGPGPSEHRSARSARGAHGAPEALVQLLSDRAQGGARERVLGLNLEGALELLRGLAEEALRPVDLPQVAVRVVAWI